MPKYEYTGPNDHYLNGGEERLTPGDVVELTEDELGEFDHYFTQISTEAAEEDSEAEEEDEGEETEAEEETSENGEEPAQREGELPIDPGEYNIPALEEKLAEEDYSESELDAIMQVEKDGRDRTGAKDAVKDAKV
jgi:hypothetical protein